MCGQESLDPSDFIDPGLGVPLFPIHYRHLVAPDRPSNIDLAKSEIEPTLTDGFANRSWIGGIAFYLSKVWPDRATNPM